MNHELPPGYRVIVGDRALGVIDPDGAVARVKIQGSLPAVAMAFVPNEVPVPVAFAIRHTMVHIAWASYKQKEAA